MGDGHPTGAGAAQSVDACPHGSVQTLPGLPHDGGTDFGRPLRHLLVVAHDRDRQGRARCNHLCGHGADQSDAIRVGKSRSEPALGLMEGLDGDEDDVRPQRDVVTRRPALHGRHGGLRHRDSVRVEAEPAAGGAVGSLS